MFWPAQSPDANIIENCWLLLNNSLQKRLYRVHSVTDMEAFFGELNHGHLANHSITLY